MNEDEVPPKGDGNDADQPPTEVLQAENKDLIIPKTIGLLGGVSFIVGTIIGAGIFISPRGVAMYSGSVGLTLVVWLICGIMSLLGAFCYSELGTVVKSSGADYSYLDEAYGSIVSFQFSWINNVLVKPASQATLALTFAEYIITTIVGSQCDLPLDLAKRLLASSLLMFLGAVNVCSVKLASRVQIVFTFTKLAAVTVVVVGGIVKISQGYTEHLETGFEGTKLHLGSMMTSFYSGMWAYDGWNTANFVVEEMINPERNLPLSIAIGVPLVVVIYFMMNVSYFTVLSIDQMIQSPAVALTWAEIVIPKFSWIIPAFVALSCLGTCNGSLFSGGRLINAAARNNHLPDILSMVHLEQFTPVTAVLCNVIIGVIIAFIGTISSLIDSMGFVMWIFYCFNFAGVIVFRYNAKYKDVPRPIKVPLVIPVICFCFSACLVVIPLVVSPQLGYFFSLAFILIGYILYVPLVHYKLRPPGIDKITQCMQLLFQVFKPQHED